MSLKHALLGLLVLCGTGLKTSAADKAVNVSSLAELAQAAGRSDQTVTMQPGVYRLMDYIPLKSIPERRKRNEYQFITFSGSNNVFHLKGVTIEEDTALRAALHAPIHTDEFLIKGGGNTIEGLTITNVGDGKALGGALLGIVGTGTTLRDCTLRVQGSAPYGYGDLFGKGGFKHSGVHITGSHTKLVGCKVYTRAFGHAFYLQEDVEDVHFENCHAEGVMRPTDDILAEKTGMPVDHGFRMVMKNWQGNDAILPGYMKALSEDGFRTYGQHKNLTFKNCTAKNMRGGFELRTKTAPRLENCTATGCERAFWVSTGAVLTRCRGDAQYGPLFFAEGDNATADLELLPAQSKIKVHALALIQGSGNKVTIKPSSKGAREEPLPIMIGYGTPGMGMSMVPIPEKEARNVMLRNETTMPVIVGAKARGGEVITLGSVKENKGRDVAVKSLAENPKAKTP